jgi:muramoyltetrapeptide carboxypeptidase LdcA involved in peptidoglycan recycling
MLIKPPKLQPSDTVAVVSLSWGGAATFPQRYEAGKRQLQETFDVRMVETRHALKDAEWLARNPQARAEDLMHAFADPSINAIVSAIGGEDSIRILPYLDLSVIRANPKIFMGYSDTTITHMACYCAGLGSFYGPAILAGFAENGGIFPYTAESVRRTLFSSESIGVIPPNTDGWTVEFLDWAQPELQTQRRALQPSTGWRWIQGEGIGAGRLIGGCLEVLDWLRGTAFWPDSAAWQNALLFLETSEEAPAPTYLARFLRSLAAMEILPHLSGILFGRPGGALSPEQHSAYDDAIRRVVRDEYGLTTLPIVTNMDFGHTDPIMVLPYGVLAQIDCAKQTFTILENAVADRRAA